MEFCKSCNDNKEIWQSINMKGEIKSDLGNDVSVHALAECYSNKIKLKSISAR